jgi:N-acetylmuramic acid 6-phosphate etherase
VLNLLSTALMIRLGHVHAGMMVDMRLSNRKLRARAAGMVAALADVDAAAAEAALAAAGDRIKTAVLVARGTDPARAQAVLDDSGDNLRAALGRLGR